jgi:HTH-type transcriptional regulator/antitoxin HipB
MPLNDTRISVTLSGPAAIANRLAGRLRDRRLRLGWTRRELADRSGIPEPTIRKFEDTGHLALERLIQLAIVLGAGGEFEDLFAQPPVLSLDDLAPAATRKRGRRAARKTAPGRRRE